MPAEFVCPSCQGRWESDAADGGLCPFCQAIVADQQAITAEPVDRLVPPGAIQEGVPLPVPDDHDYDYLPYLEGGPWLTFAFGLLALSGFVDLQQMFAELDKAAALDAFRAVGILGNQWNDAQRNANFYSLFALALFVVTTFVVFGWFRSAHRNLRHLEVTGLEYMPGQMTRGVRFPWMLFVLPYRAVQELWLASHPALKRDPEAWKHRRTSWMIRIWWLCFLLRHVRITVNVQPFPPDSPLLTNLILWTTQLSALACGLGFVAAILFIIILLRIENRQILRRRRLQEW